METASHLQAQIRELWQSVWANPVQSPHAILRDRFTIEAYRQFRRFFCAQDKLILEAGCGSGRFCVLLGQEFPDSTVIGVDVAANSIANAQQLAEALGRGNVSFEPASVFSLPYPYNTFDVVFNQGVVALFDPTGAANAIREMVRVTKPGGTVFVSVPNWMCFPHTLYKWRLERKRIRYEYGYEKSYTRRELGALLRAGGLRNIRFSGFYPAYGFYRLSRRIRRFARTVSVLGAMVDRLGETRFSRVFGFEVVAAGTK